MAKAVREKTVATALYRTMSPLNRPYKGRPIFDPSPVNLVNRANGGLLTRPQTT